MTTRDWMHGDDWERASERAAPPLVGAILWVVGLVLTALGAVALERLFG